MSNDTQGKLQLIIYTKISLIGKIFES